MSDTSYPEKLTVRLPPGWRAKLQALADADGRNLADFTREVFRRLIAAADKRAYRRRQAGRPS